MSAHINTKKIFTETFDGFWSVLSPDDIKHEYNKLLIAYGSEPRRYHTMDHIRFCLLHLDRAKQQGIVDSILFLRVAIFYHDFVYLTTDHKHNEFSSALYATTLLSDSSYQRIVFDLIMSTKTHSPSNTEEQVLCDIDLGVLGSDPADYNVYVSQIRAEHYHVPADTWSRARGEFLESMLDKDKIYHTDLFDEKQAISNMTKELQQLGK